MRFLLLFFLMHAFLLNPVQAEIPHEITSKFGTIGIFSGQPDGVLDFGSGGTVFAMGATYLLPINDMFQVGPNLGIFIATGSGSTTTNFFLLGTGRINLTKPFEEAIYAQLGLGMRVGTGNAQFVFDIGFGKRFNLLAKRLFYVPQFSIYKVGSNSVRFRLELLSLSLTL